MEQLQTNLTLLKTRDIQRTQQLNTANMMKKDKELAKAVRDVKNHQWNNLTIQDYRKIIDFISLKEGQNGIDFRKYTNSTLIRRVSEEMGIGGYVPDIRVVVNTYNEAEKGTETLMLDCLDRSISENSPSLVRKFSSILKRITSDTMQNYLDKKITINAMIKGIRTGKFGASMQLKEDLSIHEICRQMKDPDFVYVCKPQDVLAILNDSTDIYKGNLLALLSGEYNDALECFTPRQKEIIKGIFNDLNDVINLIKVYAE